MCKKLYALLLMVFILVAAITGVNQHIVRADNGILVSDLAAPSASPSETVEAPISNPVTSTLSPFTKAPFSNKLMAIFLSDHSPQPCWLSLASNQGQGLTFNPVSPQAKLAAAKIRRTAGRCRYTELHMPLGCSRHLLESSPPGFFLLI